VSSFTKEDKEIFILFYSFLKAKYIFNLKRLNFDFSKANIENIKKVYGR
jgi:hypothetical protein